MARGLRSTDAMQMSGTALEMGFSITGKEEIAEALQELEAMTVYVSVMTTKRMAEAILAESQRHVPYKDGLLHDSAAVTKVEGIGPGSAWDDITRKFTAVKANIEGTRAASDAMPSEVFEIDPTTKNAVAVEVPLVAPNWAYKSKYGTKMVTKWAAGYNTNGMAWYATFVHENPLDYTFRGGAGRESENKSPYPDVKWDHFLAKAFDLMSGKFEPSMKAGMEAVADMINRKSAARTSAALAASKAVSSAPRILGGLKKKGG